MRKFLLAVLLIAAATFAASAAPVAAAEQRPGGPQAPARASLPDIEDEVMCPTCGVPLALAFSPQAERERRFIRQQIARGRTKDQIKDSLVAEFGPSVLALPDTGDSSFNWAAYLVPIAVLLIGAAAIAVALRRWRARPALAGETNAEPPEPSAAESARLEQDLTRYDL
jgi:cytochrome c-type biogenesis protein CcmH